MAPPPLNYSTDLNSSQLNAGDAAGGSLLRCNGVCTPPVLEPAQFCPSEASSSVPSRSAPLVSPQQCPCRDGWGPAGCEMKAGDALVSSPAAVCAVMRSFIFFSFPAYCPYQ